MSFRAVRRRSARQASLRHVVPHLTVEGLECRQLLCVEGLDASGESHETHLYDTSGHHLMLDGIPDAGTIDIPVDVDPGTMGPLPSSGRRVIQQTGPMPVGETLQSQSVNAADVAALASAPAPTGALSGKIAYMNAGHGWTWGGSSWNTQRPEYSEIVEDLQTQDELTFYANYMLNAGATVVPTRPVGHQLNEVVVDNHDAGFSIQSGTWSTNSGSSTYWSNVNGTDTTDRYRFASVSATETAVARWTPNISQAGFYPVYAWWNNGSNRSIEALYRINSGGGSQEVKVNQKFTGKGWVYLGTYYFDQGTGNNVELSNKATDGSVVIADAIRFGNGMGDWTGATNQTAHAVSGKPREEELSLYWMYRSRGYTGSSAIVPESVINNGSTSDSTGGINGPPRWISYMNDETQGTNVDRVHVSFHSNGSTGDPATATARGTEGLLNNNVSWQTVNQQWWANALAEEVEEDMQALPAGTLENTWATRTNVYGSQNYGELNENNLDAFNSNPATSEMAATILEVAFHDNTQDSQLLRDPKVRDWAARASYQAAAKYFANFAGTNATLLPDPPTASRAVTDAAGNITVSWTAPGTGAANGGAGAASGYKIYYGSNGYSWANAVTTGNVTSYTFAPGTLPSAMNYFKVVATNAGGESMQRDVVVAKTQTAKRAQILIVNGYDRFDRTTDQGEAWDNPLFANDGTDNLVTYRVRARYQNTRDYVTQFAEAVEAFDPTLGVESCQNEQVINGTINLSNYQTVLWISGQESTADKSFDATERSLITSYLNGGGKMFVSGSEIGWDLDQSGVDPVFYNNVLRANYVSDDAGTYTSNGVAGSIFAGLTGITFDNGSESSGSFNTYDVQFPDVITPSAGSSIALSYSTGTTAAVQYISGNTRLVTTGFPFETITSATKRNQVMAAVLNFFAAPAAAFTPSATPGAPDLLAGTDTGNLSTDNVTNRNNGSAAKTLQFSVSGTTAGATVTIYSGGTAIGSAVASGTTTTVTTYGSITLADGTRSITARQTVSGSSESADSAALSVTVDTVAPTADVADVSPDPRTSGVASVLVTFSEAVAGFNVADLSLKRDGGANLLTGSNAPTTGNNISFTVPNLLAPTSVSGSYVLLLTASGVTDVAGNAVTADASDTWTHSLPAWLSAAGSAASWNSQTKALTITGAASITADPASDQPAVTVSGASAALTINPSSATVVNLGSLTINSGGQAILGAHGAGTIRALVVQGNPSIDATSKLDLTDNAMVVKNGSAAGIQSELVATFHGGAWSDAGGITSTTAANDATRTTTLGFGSNAEFGRTSFAGVSGLTATDILVKYTYGGDANLDGQVDIADLGLLSGGWQQSGKDWFNGDFTYDGTVDIGDLGALAGNWQKGVGNPI